MLKFVTILAATRAIFTPAFAGTWDVPTPYGEFFLSSISNDDLAFGIGNQTLLATSYDAAVIPQAFATGQVQTMITSSSTGANSATWDYVDTYTAIDAWLPKSIAVVNQKMLKAETTKKGCGYGWK